jgi:molybdopterin molybdotransferase
MLQMLSVEQALETILSRIKPLESRECPLLESLGQVLAEDIIAEINVPGWDASSRDGYAVRCEDIRGARDDSPRFLKVIETVRAGSLAKLTITSGTAIRIMTGAPMPSGADCVVGFEETDEEVRRKENGGQSPSEIGIRREEKTETNVRKAGDVVTRGARVIEKGTAIGPAEINILAALGKINIRVIRRPRVAVIATGDELMNQGKFLSGQQIYASNSLGIAAQIMRSGGIPEILGIARDNRPSLLAKIHGGMDMDAIITIGGSSRGDYDLVKKASSDLGEIIFQEVQMSPGRPFGFSLIKSDESKSEIKNVPHFILTGNPTGTMVNFEILVRPALRKMLGQPDIYPGTVEAISDETIENRKKGRRYIWSNLYTLDNTYRVKISRTPDKGALPSVSASNSLMIISEEKGRIEKGEKVKVIVLDWR